MLPHLSIPTQVVRGRFTNIPLVTALAGGLAQYHESLGIAFVDAVLEDVRWGLENPSSGRVVSTGGGAGLQDML